jgi:signal transduction histidine kinase
LYFLSSLADVDCADDCERARFECCCHSIKAFVNGRLTFTFRRSLRPRRLCSFAIATSAEHSPSLSFSSAKERRRILPVSAAIAPGFEALVFKASRGIEDIYELTYFRKDGSRFPAVVSVTALRDAQDNIIGYLLIGTDNTARKEIEEERKKLEQTLKQSNVDLENASLAKDRFLASMSHELRTPLNAVIGFTGTLLMRLPGPLTADQESQLRTVQTSARQLLSLVNDLLDLAKIESGKVELHFESVSCQSVIDEVASALSPLAVAKGLTFEVTPAASDLVVQTDRRALSQILINLTNNAIKFTERGHVSLEVAQRYVDARARTEIHIRDTGRGIPPEDKARLFQAFEQIENTTSRRHEGTGLGLYLSQKLASLLGGTILCDSEPGRGSTFTVVLPEASS